MVEYYNNTLTVEASWLVDSGVISESNYKQLSARQQLQVARRGCYGTPALVDYDSMPERFKRKVVEKLGKSPYDVVKTNQLEQYIEQNVEFSQYFENYKLSDGRFIPQNTRHEYYINAIVLEAIGRILTDKRAKRAALGHKTTKIWEKICEATIELDRTRFPHSLPANPRRLDDKYKRFRKEGLESLIHKNFVNRNAARIDDDVKESVLVELLAAPNNYDNAQVMRLYNMLSEKAGWQTVTSGTVANYREKYETMIYAGRRGSVAFSNKKAMQVKRSAPSAPLYFWTLDGWDAELMYQKTEGGRTTYHNRPTVVIVLDAFNEYPMGYAVGTQENSELIQSALRNAARHTEELFGSMHRTHQIQSDRFGISLLTPYYSTLADKVTPARAKNAKAKIIEPYFGRINRKYCQTQPNWSGFGITSDKEKQPNTEFLNKYKQHFPDFEGVCRQIEIIIQAERSAKIDALMEAWNALPAENKIELSYTNYLLQFGSTTGRTILMQHNGLTPMINGVKREYDCFDLNFRKHNSVKWQIMYDADDMTRVLAVNEEQTLQFLMEEKYVQPMALADRKAGDSEQLQRVREFNRELEKEVIDFRAGTAEQARDILTMLPELETLKKLMITDSSGQHKRNKYSPSLRQAQGTVELKPKAVNAVQDDIKSDNIWDKF